MIKTSIPDSHEHPFAEFVRILGKGKKGTRPLTEQEAFNAMSMILRGEVLDVQLGAFLTLLRVKEESAAELSGFVKATKQFEHFPTLQNKPDIDWSSYAGKRRHLPWYLFSVFLLAENNYTVFMHGATGHTVDRLYSEDVFAGLGMQVARHWDQVPEQLQQQGFCFMPLSALSPRLSELIDLRNILGLRSPVHSFARLLNPCNAALVLQGIFHPSYRPLHQETAMLLGYENVSVIKGEAGEVERNPDATCLVQRVVRGELINEEWPPMFAQRHLKETELSLDTWRNVWRGKQFHEYGEAAVIGTTALVIKALALQPTPSDAERLARAWWENRNKTMI
ncbi:MAG TPA: glycosyl transferase family protein [Pseudomonadales bacterium]|nr:glycosyl transferase family protein [Pseudomonadales bacterium]